MREAEEEAGATGVLTQVLGDLQNTESMTRWCAIEPNDSHK